MITTRLASPADAETLARLRWDFRTELRLDPTPPTPYLGGIPA